MLRASLEYLASGRGRRCRKTLVDITFGGRWSSFLKPAWHLGRPVPFADVACSARGIRPDVERRCPHTGLQAVLILLEAPV